MQKPHDPGSNVHFLHQLHCGTAPADVLDTLHAELKTAKEKRPQRPAYDGANAAQTIEGEGNTQISGETTPRQSITGNNNIQIGAVQLVVKVMVNVQR
ncbi:hypothetical protein L7Q78_15940 [Achromobacter xylosoxidans]|uniref:hypothetical protein n=1 Tax=Alcaligenes xylosoxydans xylosoxydans TaxID=85698 RepID=UPI001F05799A|nr:hypothetical protein [Achromobacter xylosoxidans]MCH1990592.1 hypothetical protein [Achromobacter xylosoxidans]MCH1994277.1 hypothetical protein [Achromobacter xylosoxidans]MCH4588632.1 hypothetical protein [Achromobacter xylosoxidans]